MKNHRSPILALGCVLLLILAVVLRFWAITWGAPYLYHPDEHLILHPALNIVRNGDLNPHWFQYPSLLIYLQSLIVAGLQPFVHAPLITDPAVNRIGPWDALPAQWPFACGGRLAVAAFAVAGIWLLYRTGTMYSGAATGLAAALFLASSPLHNESSHYLTTDVPATTLLTAALAFSLAAARSGALRHFAAAGCCAGLAAATKYTAGIVIFVPLAVACSTSLRAAARRGAVVVGTALLVFVIVCPFAILDFPAFRDGILQQRQNYLGGYSPGGNWRWYVSYLYAVGLCRPLTVACMIGLVATFLGSFLPARAAVERCSGAHPRRLTLALTLVPAVYFVVLSSYSSRTERNLMLLLPFLCLCAADVGWRALRRIMPAAPAGVGCALMALVIAAPGIVECVHHDRLLSQPDTRTVALNWIEANIPAGSSFAREEYTPQVSGEHYAVTYEWSLAHHDYEWYLGQRTDYLVVSSNIYDRALHAPYVGGPSGPRFYTFVFEHLPLVVEVAPTAERPGPTIRLYQVPHE